jgi:predicted transcriptional regulator
MEESVAERRILLALAAEIASAHVSNNAVAVDQLPSLVEQVFNALANVERAPTTPPTPEPAVPVRRSIFRDHVVCLDCGKQFSMLKRHLMSEHKLTPEQYRLRWKLSPSYPVVAPDYAKARSAIAWKTGLGRKDRAAPRKAGRKGSRKVAARR